MIAAKRALRSMVYTVPGTQAAWIRLNDLLGRGPRKAFAGWGMVTEALPPWADGGGDALSRDFVAVNAEVVERVERGEFRLSQFNDVQDKPRKLRELMWRHYVVFWSARYAASATPAPVKTLVECGVCDGLTAFYAMHAAKAVGPFRAYLYDAWEGMKAEYLLESEAASAGSYSYLSIENTKKNLAAFDRDAVFVKGFIPESFSTGGVPADVAWLHIDLNASIPTAAALETLFDRILPGAVILFDDYAWGGYQDTKVAVDRFFLGRPGLLLPMPTGQALFFRH
jgi:hypothetical protein